MHGLIRERWAQLGWELSYLGYPMSDEIGLADLSGKVSKFQGGQLIWRSATNRVHEVKSMDLIVDLPFAVGEPWLIIQANADQNGGSHRDQFVYCWDMIRAGKPQSESNGVPFVAAATAKIVYVEQGLTSGPANAGNVIIQRFGEGRYGSYLHIKNGSYTSQYAKGPGIVFLPQAIGWDSRPTPASGTVLGQVGDTGTGEGAYHMHFCVTTTPDRAAFGPFESVPVAFRNYSFSTSSGQSWTYVAAGVPKNGQWIRREPAKAGQPGTPQVNGSARVISFGTVKGQIKAGDGKPTAAGKFDVTLLSAWGEPLKKMTVNVPANALNGPWPFELANAPPYNGLRLAVRYTGPWSRPFDSVAAESGAFNLAPNGTASRPLTLKTTLIH